MKVSLHGVLTSICLLAIMGTIKFQHLLVEDYNKTKVEYNKALVDAINIDEFHDERILSLEKVIEGGVCVRPNSAKMTLGFNNTVTFTIMRCDGKPMSMTRSLESRI